MGNPDSSRTIPSSSSPNGNEIILHIPDHVSVVYDSRVLSIVDAFTMHRLYMWITSMRGIYSMTSKSSNQTQNICLCPFIRYM
jgi:hypothetical protein